MKTFIIGFGLLIFGVANAGHFDRSDLYQIKKDYNITSNIIIMPHNSMRMDDGRMAGAFYVPARNHILIRETLPKRALKRTLLHEKGHEVFYKQLTKKQQWLWCERFKTRPVTPTKYGREDCYESFSESYYFRKYGWWKNMVGADSLWEIKLIDSTR